MFSIPFSLEVPSMPTVERLSKKTEDDSQDHSPSSAKTDCGQTRGEPAGGGCDGSQLTVYQDAVQKKVLDDMAKGHRASSSDKFMPDLPHLETGHARKTC